MFSYEAGSVGKNTITANDKEYDVEIVPNGAKLFWLTHLLVRGYGNATDFQFFIDNQRAFKTELIAGSVTGTDSRKNLIVGLGESLIIPKTSKVVANITDQSGNDHDYLVQYWGSRILWF
jgi:hypothetical protein